MIALSTTAKQALVMAGAGVALVALVVLIARKQLITVRYALGWISIGLLVIIGSLFAGLVPGLGEVAGMSPTAVLLVGAVVVLVGIAIQLSISVSGLQRQLRDAIEREALNNVVHPKNGGEA